MTSPRSRWDERYGSQKFEYGAFEAFVGSGLDTLTNTGGRVQTVITNGQNAQITGVRSLHLELAAYVGGSSAFAVLAVAIIKAPTSVPPAVSITPDSLRAAGFTVYRYRLLPLVPQAQHTLGTGVKAISLKGDDSVRLMMELTISQGTSGSAPVRIASGWRYSEARVLHG